MRSTGRAYTRIGEPGAPIVCVGMGGRALARGVGGWAVGPPACTLRAIPILMPPVDGRRYDTDIPRHDARGSKRGSRRYTCEVSICSSRIEGEGAARRVPQVDGPAPAVLP